MSNCNVNLGEASKASFPDRAFRGILCSLIQPVRYLVPCEIGGAGGEEGMGDGRGGGLVSCYEGVVLHARVIVVRNVFEPS
jgi:hypothetical protein